MLTRCLKQYAENKIFFLAVKQKMWAKCSALFYYFTSTKTNDGHGSPKKICT